MRPPIVAYGLLVTAFAMVLVLAWSGTADACRPAPGSPEGMQMCKDIHGGWSDSIETPAEPKGKRHSGDRPQGQAPPSEPVPAPAAPTPTPGAGDLPVTG